MSLSKLAEIIHSDNVKKGFYETPCTPLEFHMLIVSELAEATETVREDEPFYYVENGKPEGEAVEIADALIRILDYVEYRGWNIDALVEEKLAYNRTRPFKHGKKM